MKENYKFLERVHMMSEIELMKNRHILDEYKRVSEALTSEDKMLMNMIANQKKEDSRDTKEIHEKIAQEVKGKSEAELQEMARNAFENVKETMAEPDDKEAVPAEEVEAEIKKIKE